MNPFLRSVLAILLGSAIYLVAIAVFEDGPLFSGRNLNRFLIWLIATVLVTSQAGRPAVAGRWLVMIGVVMFIVLGGGMWYLMTPIDSSEVLEVFAIFALVLIWPSILIVMGVWRQRQELAGRPTEDARR